MKSTEAKKFKILFLCTGNSARSILAEYLIKRASPQKFESFSAGSNPKGAVHPLALRVLRDDYHIDCSDARSKSWEEYKNVEFDFVITVCDNARETCPIWTGQPIIAHWSSPDPAAFDGSEEDCYRFFFQVSQQIQRRIELFTSLPLEKLDSLKLTQLTREIGMQGGVTNAQPAAS